MNFNISRTLNDFLTIFPTYWQVMINSVEKVRLAGNHNVMVCERGTMFGYSKFTLYV